MALTHRERIDRGFTTLVEGLKPFFEREMLRGLGKGWEEKAADRVLDRHQDEANWEDPHLLLKTMWKFWNEVFRETLGHAERSLVSELMDVRNDWAHRSKQFSSEDTYRALDSMHRLLQAVSAPEAARSIEETKNAVMRKRFEEQGRYEQRKAAEEIAVASEPESGLASWRDVVEPHPDVQSGNYPQAEFAADLWEVYKGSGSLEYRNPVEFYRRTYVTEGLRQLLSGALHRLSQEGGDPIIELQTSFGGGKTHSLLALYHLFSGTDATKLPNIEPILDDAGINPPDHVHRAVLVGNKISPGQPTTKPDGTEVRTLWGELAWQLGESAGGKGREAYEMLAEDDQRATNPGDTLNALFERFNPCLILIDEWVAYARQLHDDPGMPGGDFDTQFTFAQTLTEAAKATPGTLLVVSVPSSDIEVGGKRGREALTRLKHIVKRAQSPWRPATAEESFEIVRRRLFEEISPERYRQRDAVIRSFSQLYQDNASEFPSDAREKEYERRMKAAYPIHPELFDRLYDDWSSLERFQRTRGVLRLMAKVIHHLWENDDQNLLILPSTVPLHAAPVQTEIMNNLTDNWRPVIEKDVDGANSLPQKLDQENPALKRYSAARRVARTIFMGSAPKEGTEKRGISDRQIRLGCVQPGESGATFGDALRRLSDNATHLYINQNQYWYSTQPSVNRTAQDRAAQYREQKSHLIHDEIVKRLREEGKQRGPFSAVHVAPQNSSEIADEPSARLVLLGPDHPHISGASDSSAVQTAGDILQNRGSQQRTYRNMLVFMAPDAARLSELEDAAAMYLAWSSIVDEKDELNLDTFSRNQADTKCKKASDTVDSRIRETYRWVLYPVQEDPKSNQLDWTDTRLRSHDPLPQRAAKKLKNEEELLTVFSATRLRMAMDQYGLWRNRDRVSVKQLWEDLARYVYLPRLKDADLLLSAIQEGVSQTTWADNFAYAEAWDDENERYRALRAGEVGSVHMDGRSVLVKPDAAQEQIDEEAQQRERATTESEQEESSESTSSQMTTEGDDQRESATSSEPSQPKRFHGTVDLSSTRMSRDAGQIAQEVVQHLASRLDADVSITLEIQADIPEGVPDDVVRIISENARTLNFKQFDFEDE
jgi:predicted AAA+ superfamily ATPase